jgi:hypothetical protein
VLNRSTAEGAAVLTLYLALATLYFGHLWLPSPSGGTIGTGPDVQIFLWGFRWWPFALGHGLNPLISHVVWTPSGSNVLWTTTVPAISILAAPVTLAFGPTVTWNLLCMLAPALSAWAAYLLCRELTGRLWPSAVGGALFGFSSYELAEGLAHLQLTMTLCVPLLALVIVRYVKGRLSRTGLAIRVAAIASLQFLISPEILATMLLFGAITAVGALTLTPRVRTVLRDTLMWSGAGIATAAVLLSPLLVAMLSYTPHHQNMPATYSADLANVIVPTRVSALQGLWGSSIASHFSGNLAEEGSYLGIPLVVIVASFALTRRRAAGGRLLLFAVVSSILLSLGPQLTIAGHPTVWMPGALLEHLPLLGYALPARFAVYTALATSIIVAIWLTEPRRNRALRWTVAALALISVAPSTWKALWWEPTPREIASGDLNRVIPVGSNVLSIPFWNLGDRGLYAQASANMHFNLIDGWLQTVPSHNPVLTALTYQLSARKLSRLWGWRMNRFQNNLCELDIDYLIVWNYGPQLLSRLELTPRHMGHALVYRLHECPRQRSILASLLKRFGSHRDPRPVRS